MKSLISKLRLPEFSDEDDKRRARVVYFFSLFISIATILPFLTNLYKGNIPNSAVIASFAVVSMISFYLVTRGHLKVPAALLSFSLLILSFGLLITGDGIYDISLLTYPAALVVSGLLLTNRLFIISLLISLFTFWVAWYLEINGYKQTSYSSRIDLSTLTDVWIILSVTGLGVRFYINDFNRMVRMLRQQDHKLRSSEGRFRMVVENSPDLVMLVDSNFNFQLTNRKEMTTLHGTSFLDWISSDFRESARKLIKSSSGESMEVKGADNHWYRIRSRVLEAVSNNSLIIATDITETRKLLEEREILEAQFRQAQKLESLGQLASGISHDFNNLLSVIMAQAGGLERFRDNPEKMSSKVDAIIKAAERGAGLVRQILTFARKSDVHLAETNLNSLVLEVVHLMEETFPKTIRIRVVTDEALPILQADSNQLHQVLMNLCVNARDAMHNSGTLTLETVKMVANPPGSTAIPVAAIKVGDTGSGMTEEVKRRIFEPFFTTKEKGKGTGLGLAVVYGIIKSHNGWIELDSEPGKGTTFKIFLPLPVAGVQQIHQADSGPKEFIWQTRKILVVENETGLLDVQRFAFEEVGATVLAARTGSEAIRMFLQHLNSLSAVITNHDLPGITGLELINEIQSEAPNLPILLSTGSTDPEVYAKAADAGIPVLQKPYRPDQLVEAVREMLAG